MSSIRRIPAPRDSTDTTRAGARLPSALKQQARGRYPEISGGALRGRAALSNRDSRYLPTQVERESDPRYSAISAIAAKISNADTSGVDTSGVDTSGVDTSGSEVSGVERPLEDPAPRTECRPENAGRIIARNQSPDVPFEQSINPYRGCEHGCIYCYARPTHAWLDLSPGLDFETQLTYKPNAAERLEEELRAPGYRCSPITIGANTDPYQPVEKTYEITRGVLEVLQRYQHPVTIITKGNLITRDIDILSEMATSRLVSVAVSVTTLNRDLKRVMEPRTPEGSARLDTIRTLSSAGIPVGVLVAPVIPALNDSELETILQSAVEAGAVSAAYILLRLPLEIRELFEEWLQRHYPLRWNHVMSLVRQSRGGANYDTRFGHRMRGTGTFADLLSRRFDIACRKLGIERREYLQKLDCSRFEPPPRSGDQLSLL